MLKTEPKREYERDERAERSELEQHSSPENQEGKDGDEGTDQEISILGLQELIHLHIVLLEDLSLDKTVALVALTNSENSLDFRVEKQQEPNPCENRPEDSPHKHIPDVILLLEEIHITQGTHHIRQPALEIGTGNSDFVAINLLRTIALHLLFRVDLTHGIQVEKTTMELEMPWLLELISKLNFVSNASALRRGEHIAVLCFLQCLSIHIGDRINVAFVQLILLVGVRPRAHQGRLIRFGVGEATVVINRLLNRVVSTLGVILLIAIQLDCIAGEGFLCSYRDCQSLKCIRSSGIPAKR
mmetsp:Transcript_19479/g.54165  ORF Transcript_19479/g.54165 Transcript_19479/m.54165 type:complete len:300 (+) Transcript_19479:382-1281(+)